MSGAHTLAPWEVRSTRDGRGEGLTIFAASAGRSGRPLARIISKAFGAKNANADAHLIAAAPDMREALRVALYAITEIDNGHKSLPTIRAALKKADAK